MTDTGDLARTIAAMTNGGVRQVLAGRNALIRKMFAFLRKQVGLPCEILLLCSASGLVLDAVLPDLERDIAGRTIPLDELRQYHKKLAFRASPAGYVLISSRRERADAVLESLQKSLDDLLDIAESDGRHKDHLLKCFDSARNAISIFDREAHLLFANETFCKFFHIDDRAAVIGMHIHDVLKRHGISVHAMDTNTTRLTMMDVLKTGKETLDCGVRLESQLDPGYVQLVDNDMYPVLGERGDVSGMIEISRSHQQVMKRTRKIMGLSAEYGFKDIIGGSEAIKDKIKLAKEFALTSGNVLIRGESGVGKELFAQSIHNYSARSKGPFVALNCASFPAELIESELFGYGEGAFTGASKKGHIGKIELADGGTLFLDEIGELPHYFQSKLLRVLETWVVTRVGSTKEIPVDVRLVAATNRNLKEMVAAGLFRQDLYYRLHVLELEIPPLRERPGDVLLLAEHFLKQSAEQNGRAVKTMAPDARKILREYAWPGNARELRNCMNRIDLLTKDDLLTGREFAACLNPKENTMDSRADETPENRIDKRMKDIDACYARLLGEALDITGGNKKEAAELLGVSRKTFYRMLEKYI